MPSATFFRLPAEKRRTLIDAALTEFSRVPYDQASINKIIQAAGIPRGSFYMYFDDKDDLFRYLLGFFRKQLSDVICDLLDQNNGDLFRAFEVLFGQFLQKQSRQEPCDPLVLKLFSILRLNSLMHPGVLFNPAECNPLIEDIRPHINAACLSLEHEEDLSDILRILAGVTFSSLTEPSVGEAGSVQTRTQRYLHVLNLLQRGAAAPQPTHT